MTDKTKGRASYDPQADAIGVYFAPEGAEYDESEEVAPGIVLDYDKQGRVIGVELLYVRKLLTQGSLEHDHAKRNVKSV
jgi:uncharacterized protein YuzE